MLQVILTAVEEDLAAAWADQCGHFDMVRVHHGSIFDVECDAVVSPANSFGFMDGGIDMAYSEHFGWGVQERLQAVIRDHHRGELLVGDAEVVDTRDAAIPHLIAAPTMRVPMLLRNSVNPFLAARAALQLVLHGSFREGACAGKPIAASIKKIAFPGLGTGVGAVSPQVCASQVAAALAECLGPTTSFPESWEEAQIQHELLHASNLQRSLMQQLKSGRAANRADRPQGRCPLCRVAYFPEPDIWMQNAPCPECGKDVFPIFEALEAMHLTPQQMQVYKTRCKVDSAEAVARRLVLTKVTLALFIFSIEQMLWPQD